MKTAEQNYRLLQEIEANRRFLLMAYEQNPTLLKSAEARIRPSSDSRVADCPNEAVAKCDQKP